MALFDLALFDDALFDTGDNFSTTITESAISIGDSVAASFGAVRILTDTVPITEDLARKLDAIRNIIEGSEAMFDIAIFDDNIFDTDTTLTGAIADSLDRRFDAFRDLGDTVPITEDLQRRVDAFRTLGDVTPVTEDLQRILAAFRDLTEPTIAITEDIQRQLGFIRNLVESTPITELLSIDLIQGVITTILRQVTDITRILRAVTDDTVIKRNSVKE